eukprot:4157910-Amphidinium_carterae.1
MAVKGVPEVKKHFCDEKDDHGCRWVTSLQKSNGKSTSEVDTAVKMLNAPSVKCPKPTKSR